MRKPATQQVPAATIEARGPAFSTHVPKIAEEMPSMRIEIEKIQPIEISPASKCAMKGFLKTLKA